MFNLKYICHLKLNSDGITTPSYFKRITTPMFLSDFKKWWFNFHWDQVPYPSSQTTKTGSHIFVVLIIMALQVWRFASLNLDRDHISTDKFLLKELEYFQLTTEYFFPVIHKIKKYCHYKLLAMHIFKCCLFDCLIL